jgi:hypothetical protein
VVCGHADRPASAAALGDIHAATTKRGEGIMTIFDHNGNGRRRKRQRQAKRREKQLRRQQRADQHRRERQASQPQRPPASPPDPAPLRRFLLDRLAEAGGVLYAAKTASLDSAWEACDRVAEAGGDFAAFVLPRSGGRVGFALVSTTCAAPGPHECPADHLVTAEKLAHFAGLAAGTGSLQARVSARWLALLDQAFGHPPDDSPAWHYMGPEEPT